MVTESIHPRLTHDRRYPNLGIAMDEQIIVVASSRIHFLSIHIENSTPPFKRAVA
jgi:hypothetical protein